MHLYTLRNIFQYTLFIFFLSSCTGIDDSETESNTTDKVIGIVTIPGNSQSKVAINLDLLSISFDGAVSTKTISNENIVFVPSIDFSLDKSLLATRGLLLLIVNNELIPNTTYNAVISGIQDMNGKLIPDNNWQFTTSAVEDLLAPTAPANLTTSGTIQSTSVSLTWGASTDDNQLGGYQILRDSSVLAITTGTSFTDSTVSANQNYQYQIVAFDLAQNTSNSNTLSVTTPALPAQQDTQAPTTPASLRLASGGGLSSSSAELLWNASTDNIAVSGYRIIRNSNVITTVSASATSFNNTGLSASTTYQFQVEAFDAAGNTARTSNLSVTTLAGADTTNPSVPANLIETAKTTSSAAFSWNASTDNIAVTGYRIVRNSSVIATLSAATTSYSNTGLSASTTYQYQVEAFDAAGNTARTNSLAITTQASSDTTSPTAPGNLTETSKTNSLAAFSWSASSDNIAVTGYRVLRDSSVIASLSAATTSYTNTGLSATTTYQYQVEAFDAAGNTAKTGNLAITTLVAPSITCTTTINPGQSFNTAFATLQAGDTLCLNDGIYNQAMDIPSNINVRAVNDGQAEIDGMGTLGEEWTGGLVQMKGSNSSVRGLRVHHSSINAHVCYMQGTSHTMQVMSCSHAGMQKHKNPIFMTGTGHLLEDSWAFGKGRYVVQCFKGSNMTLRHNVARWDITTPNTPTEPNAGFSIYNCNGMTVENNVSIDYALSAQLMKFGADFYAPHNAGEWPDNNNNHYLGNYAINHALGNSNRRGMQFDAAGAATAQNNVIKDFYVNTSDFGVVIPSYINDLAMDNCSFLNIDIDDVVGGSQNNISTCNGTASYGSVYVNRVKVSNNLFPWKNEALIKADMCRSGERQSDWCATNLSLSDYMASF